MNLIKKTVILTDGADGYVAVIRVGNDVGAKIVGAKFKEGMYAGLKIGSGKPIFVRLNGEKTEIPLPDVSFQQNDTIGCVVADGSDLVARGGNGIKLKEVVDYFNNREETLIEEPLVFADSTSETDVVEDIENKEEIKITDEEMSEEKQAFFDRLATKTEGNFYVGIREKLDELFVIYPSEKHLNELIPNSEWIKINYDGEDYYVVGKLKENDRTVLIGYGVPGKKGANPPKIADEIASYLTVEGIQPYDGYWLIFQEGATGKIVKA